MAFDDPKESDVIENNFALAITQKINKKTGEAQLSIESKNSGMSDIEVFFLVECWLEKCRNNIKDKVKDAINIGGDPDERYKK